MSTLLSPAPVAPSRRLPASPVAMPYSAVHQNKDLQRWKFSLIPLVASQGLDAASSWGMRELNPVLAGPDGRFGAKAAAMKFGVTGAFIGLEYLIVKKYPRSARVFQKINWSGAALTSSFAVHNYVIR